MKSRISSSLILGIFFSILGQSCNTDPNKDIHELARLKPFHTFMYEYIEEKEGKSYAYSGLIFYQGDSRFSTSHFPIRYQPEHDSVVHSHLLDSSSVEVVIMNSKTLKQDTITLKLNEEATHMFERLVKEKKEQ